MSIILVKKKSKNNLTISVHNKGLKSWPRMICAGPDTHGDCTDLSTQHCSVFEHEVRSCQRLSRIHFLDSVLCERSCEDSLWFFEISHRIHLSCVLFTVLLLCGSTCPHLWATHWVQQVRAESYWCGVNTTLRLRSVSECRSAAELHHTSTRSTCSHLYSIQARLETN